MAPTNTGSGRSVFVIERSIASAAGSTTGGVGAGGVGSARGRRRGGGGVTVTVTLSSFESRPADGCLGGVRDRAAVEVGLLDRVRGGAGDSLARIEEAVVVADRVHGRAGDRRLVVGDRDRARQAHVAGVGDQVAVGDHVAHRVSRERRGRLVEQTAFSSARLDGRLVLRGVDLARARLGGVGDRAAVQVGLRDRVGSGAGDSLARIEEAVVVADRVHSRAADRRLVVGHGDRAGRRTLPLLVTR